ncbi:hypothetical protein BKA59DRAFT_529824 [Fusarium tricinctum]|uniref:Uncharacterized protein n=1 Tax=Fusarium tricinctum TaxID=61284 RepID=A0A8K0RVA2_9HYPO|nr:hypothetical protein BKA59DRAFT_529824 [Fusarium tricinctum]
MSTERPSGRPSAADTFQLWLDKLHEKGYPQDPTIHAVYKRIGTAFSDVKKNMSTNLANELAHFTWKKMISLTSDTPRDILTLDIVRDITRCPAYQVLKGASASGMSINFPDWFFLATISSHWGVQFPIDKVSFPSGLSHEEQLMRFRRIKERKPQSERPSGTLGPDVSKPAHAPCSDMASSDLDPVDKAGQGREHEEETKCMQCHIAELQSWKIECGLSKFDTDHRLRNLSKLVDECRNTMKSQAGQIATLNEENKALRMSFVNHQALVHESVKSIARNWSDKRKHATNHEARGGGKRQCISETHQSTNDDTQ